MRSLKVKIKHLDFNGNGTINLHQRVVKTVIKHGYKRVQIQGRIYQLRGGYVLPKRLGFLPIIYVENYYN